MNLIQLHNEMLGYNYEKTAEQEIVDERLEILEKYASFADQALSDEFGNDYDEDDVVKLAEMLIANDIETEEAAEKVAEADQLGRIHARAFVDELDALLNS